MHYLILILLPFFTFTLNSFSQELVPDSTKHIILQKKANERTFVQIKKYASVKLWPTGESKPIKGILEGFTDSTLTINGQEFSFDAIDKMAVRHPGLLGFGMLGVGAGGVMATWGYFTFQNGVSSECQGFSCIFPILIGGASFVVGIAAGTIGIAFLAGSGRQFKSEKWDVKVVALD